MAQVGDLITFKTLGERKFAIVTGNSKNSVLLQSLEPGKNGFITYGFESKYATNITNQLNKSDEMIKRYKQRAGAAEAIIASIKSHLDDLWMDGNASEHEYAFNTLKHIEKIERGEV